MRARLGDDRIYQPKNFSKKNSQSLVNNSLSRFQAPSVFQFVGCLDRNSDEQGKMNKRQPSARVGQRFSIHNSKVSQVANLPCSHLIASVSHIVDEGT